MLVLKIGIQVYPMRQMDLRKRPTLDVQQNRSTTASRSKRPNSGVKKSHRARSIIGEVDMDAPRISTGTAGGSLSRSRIVNPELNVDRQAGYNQQAQFLL
jgi:hypothetical protein